MDELETYCRDQVESWASEMMSAIDDPRQPLRYFELHIVQSMYIEEQILDFQTHSNFKI